METRWGLEAFESWLWTDFPTCCGIICSDEAARLMANTWSLQEMEIQDDISGAISTCFVLFWTIWTDASDPTISPEPAFLIHTINRRWKVKWLLQKVYEKFQTIDTAHMNHFVRHGWTFRYIKNLHTALDGVLGSELQFEAEPEAGAEFISHR